MLPSTVLYFSELAFYSLNSITHESDSQLRFFKIGILLKVMGKIFYHLPMAAALGRTEVNKKKKDRENG